MVNVQPYAADDVEMIAAHQVVNAVDRAVGAVFDGQKPVLAKPLFHRLKNAFKAPEIHDAGGFKQLVAGDLGVGPLHALAGHYALLREKLRRIFRRFQNFPYERRFPGVQANLVGAA